MKNASRVFPGKSRLPHPATHAMVVVVIEVALTVRMGFGKGRNENGTGHCGSRQDLCDALHETLPGRSTGDPAGTSLTPVVDKPCTAFTLN